MDELLALPTGEYMNDRTDGAIRQHERRARSMVDKPRPGDLAHFRIPWMDEPDRTGIIVGMRHLPVKGNLPGDAYMQVRHYQVYEMEADISVYVQRKHLRVEPQESREELFAAAEAQFREHLRMSSDRWEGVLDGNEKPLFFWGHIASRDWRE